MGDKLLPCPFCGSKPEAWRGDAGGKLHAVCPSCCIPCRVEVWNRRAPDPPAEQMAEALRFYVKWTESDPKDHGKPARDALAAWEGRGR